MARRLLGWGSGDSSELRAAPQPLGLTHFVHDGPVWDSGTGHILRGHIDSLATVPYRWATEPRWQAIAFDEARFGESGHTAADWLWRAAECRRQCLRLGRTAGPLWLTWNATWGLDAAAIAAELAPLRGHYAWFLPQLFLHSAPDLFGRLYARTQVLIAATVQAGLTEQSFPIINISDRPDSPWATQRPEEDGRFRAVFGPHSEAYASVFAAYRSVLRSGPELRSLGYWSADLASPASTIGFTALCFDTGAFTLRAAEG